MADGGVLPAEWASAELREKHHTYIRRRVPGEGWNLEHRLVYEAVAGHPLGRRKLTWLDGDRTNNRPENLALVGATPLVAGPRPRGKSRARSRVSITLPPEVKAALTARARAETRVPAELAAEWIRERLVVAEAEVEARERLGRRTR